MDTGEGTLWSELERRFAWFHGAGIHLGTRRPNQKPILLMADRSGRVRAFAKIGWDPATVELVGREATALTSARPAEPVVMPELLDDFPWGARRIVVQSVVTIGETGRGLVTPDRLAEVIAAVSGAQERPAELGLRDYGERLQARLDGAYELQPDVSSRLRELVEQETHGTLLFGAWHGDLTPWNCSLVGASMTVWDWERWASSRPVGLDAVHYHLHLGQLVDDPLEARNQAEHDVEPVLDALGVPPQRRRALHVFHAAELALRFAPHPQMSELVLALGSSFNNVRERP